MSKTRELRTIKKLQQKVLNLKEQISLRDKRDTRIRDMGERPALEKRVAELQKENSDLLSQVSDLEHDLDAAREELTTTGEQVLALVKEIDMRKEISEGTL